MSNEKFNSTLRERVEQNVVVWLLGTLLTGFLAGVAAYRTILEIAGVKGISSAEQQISAEEKLALERGVTKLKSELQNEKARVGELQVQLTNAAASVRSRSEKEEPNAQTTRGSDAKARSVVIGTRLLIQYHSHRSSDVLLIQQKLRQLGVVVTAQPQPDGERYLSPANKILYEAEGLEKAAIIVQALTDVIPIGMQYEVTNENTDLWLLLY